MPFSFRENDIPFLPRSPRIIFSGAARQGGTCGTLAIHTFLSVHVHVHIPCRPAFTFRRRAQYLAILLSACDVMVPFFAALFPTRQRERASEGNDENTSRRTGDSEGGYPTVHLITCEELRIEPGLGVSSRRARTLS